MKKNAPALGKKRKRPSTEKSKLVVVLRVLDDSNFSSSGGGGSDDYDGDDDDDDDDDGDSDSDSDSDDDKMRNAHAAYETHNGRNTVVQACFGSYCIVLSYIRQCQHKHKHKHEQEQEQQTNANFV